ncbi:retrovirus-related pol polyprotein from transposon TNT 1-94 [Tanacetum coccineum]
MTRHRDKLINFVSKFIGLGHNLFSVGQFCESDLEVAFRKHTCFVRNLEGVDLLSGSRGTNLYTILIADMMKSSPICLLSKASKTKSWLWHRCLSHLNFGTINQLAKQGLVKGLPKLKYTKYHLCSACQMGKSKKESYPYKPKSSTNEKLQMLHMDLCGPMRVESINKKRYILVIVDDYSCFTWVKFLRTKDEAPEIIINFLKQAQVSLNATVRYLRTDNDNEFFNQTLRNYTEEDLGKLQPKADIGIFIDYSPTKKAYRIYNIRTRQIMETMNVHFDELTQMDSKQHNLGPELNGLTFGLGGVTLMLNQAASTSAKPPTKNDWDVPFQPINVEEPHNEEVAEFDSDTFTIKEEPKNYREAMIESSWIEAMQEEIHEFERLKVWELVPRPDKDRCCASCYRLGCVVCVWKMGSGGKGTGKRMISSKRSNGDQAITDHAKPIEIPKAVGNDTSTSFDESLMNPSCDIHVEIPAGWDSASPLVNEDVSRDSGFSSHVSLAGAESNTHFGMESDRPAIGGKEAGKSSLFTTSQGLALFGVTLTSLKDIDDLTRRLEAGEYEEVMSKMTREERKAILATLEISGRTYLNHVKGFLLTLWLRETWLMDKPTSYVGEAMGLKPELSKSKANIRLLFSENLCEGVNFSIPRKVVEMNNDELQRFFLLSVQNFCWELKVFILSTAKPRVSTAQVTTANTNQLVLLE